MVQAGKHRGGVLPTLLILAMTAVWGSTFFLIRDLVKIMPTLDFLSVRFTIAAVVMVALFWRHLRRLTRRDWLAGALIGGLYGAAQILQTFGLERTSATMSGFVTGLYVVFTPILAALVFRDRLGGAVWTAVALSLAGLATLSLQPGGLQFGPGEWLTLASAIVYAAQILATGRWSTVSNATGLAVVQTMTIAAMTTVVAAPDGYILPTSSTHWIVIAYMALIAGAGAVWAQTWAQARIAPARAAVLMTTEPLFAALFAIGIGGEPFTLRVVVGGLLIVSAMYVVELGSRRAPPAEAIHPTAP
ncbi:DMT family transporter [Propionicicella superfundia]|uniref:DMT family transporter n=1 Tax=Propionicicella superfundia TaxID=348582 RepID=UPI0003F99D27|nr:DMT family transporter [Propionicicella superfundia]